jgi:hypothetical protein
MKERNEAMKENGHHENTCVMYMLEAHVVDRAEWSRPGGLSPS